MTDEQGELPFTQTDPDPAEGWVLLAQRIEIPEGEGLARTIGETELALFREGEQVSCLQDFCPHRGAGISDGRIVDGHVICPWHGWKYALENGHCSTLPGSASAICYESRVVGEGVWVRLVRTNPDA